MSRTPSTDQVRADYILCGAVPGSDAANESADAFDRWLADRDARIKAQAWGEGHAAGYSDGMLAAEAPAPETPNPYREEAPDA